MPPLRPTSKRFSPIHAFPACVGLLGAFAMSLAHADTGASAEPDIRFTGALVTGSPPLPKDMFNIEPYLIDTQVRGQYDEHGNRHDVDGVPDSWTLAVPMAYGLTDRLTVGATLTAGYASEQTGGRKWEMGDTGVSAQYLLATGEKHNSALAASIKQNFTTGRYDELDRHNLAEATGSGAPTTQLVLAGQMYLLEGRNLRARFNVGWRLPGADASLDGESVYGTPAGFRGRADLHAASQASVSFEYSFNPQWVAAADLVCRFCPSPASGRGKGREATRVRASEATESKTTMPGGNAAIHGATSRATDRPARPSLDGRSADRAAVPPKRSASPTSQPSAASIRRCSDRPGSRRQDATPDRAIPR